MNYARYLEISRQIGLLEQEKKILSQEILKHMKEEKTDRVVEDMGVISIKSRTGWKYQPSVKSKIETIQKEAQESGEAEKVETEYLSTSLR